MVLEDKVNYIANGESHLADTSIYGTVPGDPTGALAAELNKYTAYLRDRGYITAGMESFLRLDPCHLRTQQMYFLKKVHKSPMQVRPIVSGSSGPTEKLSQLLDHFIAPHVKATKSYLSDSSHLVNILNSSPFPSNIILATVDVVGLYLNIPHSEGIDASIRHMYSDLDTAPPFPPEVARTFFEVVLNQNYFEFNGSMFRQTQGTAMGTRMAPSYANLFMAWLEGPLLSSSGSEDLLLWRRFIDDIFLVWKGTSASLTAFLNHLNTIHNTIKFTYTVHPSSVDFMDLTIYKGPRFQGVGRLDVKPFFKAVNKFCYLHYSSSHPRTLFSGIAKGEFTRAARHSTNLLSYRETCTLLSHKLHSRGYPWRLIDSARAAVPYTPWDAALNVPGSNHTDNTLSGPSPGLSPSPGPGPSPGRPSAGPGPSPDPSTGPGAGPSPSQQLVSTGPSRAPSHEPITGHSPLEKDRRILPFICPFSDRILTGSLRKALDSGPSRIRPTIAFQKGKALKNLLVRARLRGAPKPAPMDLESPIKHAPTLKPCSVPCGRAMCGTCRHMSKLPNVFSEEHWYRCPQHTNCDTAYCVYAITCARCKPGKTYIGQTARPLKERMSGHRQAFGKGSPRPIYRHFRQRGHTFADVRVTILEKGVNRRDLLSREHHWITQLGTQYPKGLNSTLDPQYPTS